jgi:hypothetical protein
MNIIRTPAVELSAIPALAYKQKLASGGAGIRLLRLDQDASAAFTLDKRGDLVAFGTVNTALFPAAAVKEAFELTVGIPYSSRGKISVSGYAQVKEPEDVTEAETAAIDMVDSREYAALVAAYGDGNGKLNYTLLNKNFIQFAAKSKVVADLVAKKTGDEDILVYIVKNRAGYLAKSKEAPTDDETRALIETLDEIDPRAAFKELKSYIRRLLAHK